MTHPDGVEDLHAGSTRRAEDRSRYHWLLVIPVVVPLVTAVFNADGPRLGGFPLYYWLQLAYVALVVVTTTAVYRLTKRGR